MNFDVVLLGTGAAVPVPSRGTTSQFLDIHGHTYLIDAGEGVTVVATREVSISEAQRCFHRPHAWDHVLGLRGC